MDRRWDRRDETRRAATPAAAAVPSPTCPPSAHAPSSNRTPTDEGLRNHSALSKTRSYSPFYIYFISPASNSVKMKIIIAGGAGYIGSHIVRELSKHSHELVILDNLSTGHTQSIPKGVAFEQGDIRDKAFLETVFSKHVPDAVFHFSASIEVAQSVADPLSYYENNVSGTITLLQAMQKHKTKYFIFSSTAALFGMPERVPIEADDKTHPINPYGETKLVVEKLLQSCDEAFGLKSVCLRYFNACGADEAGDIGEDHTPESHLIPLILQVPLGKREKIFIFGDDYPTEDGSCVRDYVHVTDLASGHALALEYLAKHNISNRFNLGSGEGYSVKQIIEAARRVTGHPIPAEIKPRRAGDPATLIASSEKAEKILGWKRKYDTIDSILATAWNFHQKHPKGF
ncbi:uncharacterized protein EV422DRAFT_122736 [Fimicolochytrium jonesii]|uniref:uncharacterized protein n=1 Tax=Fimicolochytrium jonesii TaxID=1396493 RepID=UPI0022FEDE8A|nr:uncharacterized protein EV422DRAFT_122736 [Fimicolochytrium jonesii]KAI8819247.1 hypothetical protein EV422DRAFT_122736 [Fimicolochytrium jonesii]